VYVADTRSNLVKRYSGQIIKAFIGNQNSGALLHIHVRKKKSGERASH
jgi:hypothetical protein